MRNAHPVSQNAGKGSCSVLSPGAATLTPCLFRGRTPVADLVERSPFSRFGKLSPSRVIQHQIHHDWMEIWLSRTGAAGDQGPNGVGMEGI